MNSSIQILFDHESDADNASVLCMNGCLTSAGMAIKTSADPDAKFANTITYQIDGILHAKTTANLDLSALLSGETSLVIADDYHTVIAFFLDADGNVTADMATPAAITETIPAIPSYDNDLVCFGALTIKNETGSNFTVGTTHLDASGVTATYYNFGTCFPGMVLGA